MNCQQYTDLTATEQYEFIGKLVIAVQQDEGLYNAARAITRVAASRGIYDTVKVHADASALSDLDNPIE